MTTMSAADLRERLCAAFAWRGDRGDDGFRADVTGWWRDPALLQDLGAGLAGLFADEAPTVVLGLPSRGVLLGALVARELGVGLVEVRKDPSPAADSDQWLTVTTPPDYRDRHLELGFRRTLVRTTDRVLLVDDWVATGGQALGAQRLVDAAGAAWLGTAVVVDALVEHRTRRALGVRALVHERDLG
ncbi:adenine phosphoribosyltransferase [Geodermatophilus sp. DSM 45219]|nr:adenine phosphoribosyltransferase [Geodermatophilus sp. DSM 45219]